MDDALCQAIDELSGAEGEVRVVSRTMKGSVASLTNSAHDRPSVSITLITRAENSPHSLNNCEILHRCSDSYLLGLVW